MSAPVTVRALAESETPVCVVHDGSAQRLGIDPDNVSGCGVFAELVVVDDVPGQPDNEYPACLGHVGVVCRSLVDPDREGVIGGIS